jgi:copper chaperone CopZ
MAIGTAVRKIPGVKTRSASLPPQAIIVDQDTWISDNASLFQVLR